MQNHKKLILLSFALALLPMIIGALFYNQLPDQLPVHYNVQGIADEYYHKAGALFGIPSAMVGMQLFLIFFTLADPKNKKNTPQMFLLTIWIVPIMSFFVTGITILYGFNIRLDVAKIITGLVGVMFILIGNYMPKCKQSYTIGIKTPWTLSDQDIWFKTHRLAGFLWLICGILVLILNFVGLSVMLFGIFLITALVPPIYSYILYRKKEKEEN